MIWTWITSNVAKLLIIASLIGGGIFLVKDDINIHKQLSAAIVNNKSLEQGMLTYKDKAGQLHSLTIQQEETISQLKYSKDTVVQQLLVQVKKDGVNINKLTQIGQVRTKLVHDTTLSYKPMVDTVVDFSKPPYIHNVMKIGRDSIKNELAVTNIQDLIFHDRKETIFPPRKFFLWRLFQKKQVVTQVEITNANKDIMVTNQQFTHVIK